LSGGALDGGTERYGGQFGMGVSSNSHGTFFLGIDANPDNTLLRDENALPIEPIELIAAAITVQTGSCCTDLGPGTSQCDNNVTYDECVASSGGGTFDFTADGLCAGDLDGDGDDDSCAGCINDSQCADGNSCTTNSCDEASGLCSAGPNFNPNATQCCNETPSDAADDIDGANAGDLTTIDDGDVCTDDDCDPTTGAVSHDFNTAACDDDNACTAGDVCTMGACGGVNINDIPCPGGDAECPNGDCDEATGFCNCALETKLSLDVAPGDKPDDNCFQCGDKVFVEVNIAAGSEVVTGGQFLIVYDPDCLDFKFIVDSNPGPGPGSSGIQPSDDFPLLIYSDVNESAGTIFIAVGCMPGDPDCGTSLAATLATLQFDKLCVCGECNLTFDSVNPANTILSDDTGQPVPITTNPSKTIRLSGELTINVPGNVSVNPDCGFPTAIITWDPVSASDSCDGEIASECDEDFPNICCTNTHSGGVPIDHLAEAGGEFPQGTSTFCCTAENDCGHATEETCWTVTVSDQHSMDIVVQLSPVMRNVPLTRCICFEFFPDCVQEPTEWCQDLVFGPPYDFAGHNTTKIKVPKGQYACITARDCLHTLRSVSDIECVGDQLVAEFKGDPFFGGNWLINGNIHDPCWKGEEEGSTHDVIDILDFGTFVAQFGAILNPNTPCGTLGPHSDINGDGMVDGSDFAFISQNFLEESKDSCCPGDQTAFNPDPPITSITVKELRRMGLGDLAVADLNGDGTLDQADMTAFLQGQVPQRDSKREGRGAGTRPSLGN
jgi:hypothetical protein